MRFILQFALTEHAAIPEKICTPKWVNELLTVHNNGSSDQVAWDTFYYKNDDKSIVEANWPQPSFNSNKYFIFLGGHVLFRIKEADKRGKYVPTPEEVLSIILHYGDHHYDVLKGNYHIILYDKLNRSVIVYSSPLSLFPAWYTIQDGVLFVSNLLESLLRAKRSLSINQQGLVEFALFDHNLGVNTIYNDIFLLEGGHYVRISENERLNLLVYDIANWITKTPRNRKDSLPEINNLLKRHISEFTQGVKKFNLSLTGGFDGRLNLSFIDRSDYSKLHAFSYGMQHSLQLEIPKIISKKLDFNYSEILLEDEFENSYAKIGMDTIMYSGGITPFIRANYPYAYGKIKNFSRNCILGQCDMIRPLYTNPAGAIFNSFSHELFYNEQSGCFYDACFALAKDGFLDEGLFSKNLIDGIYRFVREKYITPYPGLTRNEKYYLFLMKESMLKFWNTECHVVDLFVNDFISFSDLDYIESLSKSEYFGLYKGIFAANQFERRKSHDLYVDLMKINNDKLNDIIVDRQYKPKWIKRAPLGYLIIALGKWKENRRIRKVGNDTFGGMKWSEKFYTCYKNEIIQPNKYFNLANLIANKPYQDNNDFRYDRHVSLKLWMQYIGIH